ncbi:hypothetical protein LCDVSa063R [Lymphocystis disease virus 3]|uniref:Uncharacterized protein n=1 Tax=Lymphocystis disease virus 3 TaxID=2560566 RepID=A0A1B2RVX9_9VIRU|nr:hypothetical protein BZK12_gp063 [Lymphocystis disease virus Sa]AOC55147.1 hypothetical protein LCDVSa063R [Lymphocystis disease virus 3]
MQQNFKSYKPRFGRNYDLERFGEILQDVRYRLTPSEVYKT